MEHLVIGNKGEVGSAIQKIFDCHGHDADTIIGLSKVDVMHICFGYSEKFETQVSSYQQKYQPLHTVIHSTVPVGTSRKLNATHSPIRGLHPDLYEGILTFPKFLGGPEASELAHEFKRAGMKVILCDKQETTELGKLLDTEYYRACIEFVHRAKALTEEFNVPFSEAYTLFNLTYNEGYTALDHPEFVRPTLQPIMTEIGGHCVKPNEKLLIASQEKLL